MKRILSLALVVLLCLIFPGCSGETEKPRQPVNFYYRRAELTYGSVDSLIAPVEAEAAGYEDDTVDLLNTYLRGVGGAGFEPTFPVGTKLLSMGILDGTAHLQVTSSLARISGIDLTVACACLSLTVMELTGAQAVCITAANETLDGNPSVTMTMDTLLLLDLYEPEPTR